MTSIRWRAAALALALCAAGCGIGATLESTSWHADIDSLPSADCVKQAIAATPGMSLVSYSHDDKRQLFAPALGIDHYLLHVPALGFVEPVDMGLHIGRSDKSTPVAFDLNYGYWPKYQNITDPVAKALIGNIARHCNVPELAERAKRIDSQSWHPHLFNV